MSPIDRINKFEEIGVVCLQETWTSEKDDVSLFHLPNYKLFHKGKPCSNHGGLFMYVHERFKATQLNMSFTSTTWKGQCVKITQSQTYAKHYIIGNIYIGLFLRDQMILIYFFRSSMIS